jgi:thiol-disulfide isomerase/thioredoxin
MRRTLVAAAVAGLGMHVAVAQGGAAAPSLKVGSPAPALKPAAWIQGEPVPALATGTIYVVEFWATWCGPCRLSTPHLNELHEKYKDRGVIVIGQNVWEEDDAAVAEFVKAMGTNMAYRVTLDDKTQNPDGAMAALWMDAAGQQGVPAAFVVDRAGRIAWIGHPLDGLDEVLEEMVADAFDSAAAATKQTRRNELNRRLRQALADERWPSFSTPSRASSS